MWDGGRHRARCRAPAQASAAPVAPGEWPIYNRDLAGTRYSPLKEITAANVSRLAPAWSYRLQSSGGGPLGGGSSAVPLVVGGVMYVPSGNRVVAIDGVSGKRCGSTKCRRLRAQPRAAAGGAAAAGRPSARGLGYWPGAGTREPRILFLAGSRLMALDAATAPRRQASAPTG
jgi:glucose dehydrogenase